MVLRKLCDDRLRLVALKLLLLTKFRLLGLVLPGVKSQTKVTPNGLLLCLVRRCRNLAQHRPVTLTELVVNSEPKLWMCCLPSTQSDRCPAPRLKRLSIHDVIVSMCCGLSSVPVVLTLHIRLLSMLLPWCIALMQLTWNGSMPLLPTVLIIAHERR